jgi:hypothetical protein
MKFSSALFLAFTSAVAAFIEDFESFSPGDVVEQIVPGNGMKIKVLGKGCSGDAMVFDSASPTGGDSDLFTEDKGNILILSEDGDASDPDDCKTGGVLKFKFVQHAFVSSVGLLDHDEGARILVFKPWGASYAIDVPPTSDNGYESIPINDVVWKINVKFKGSGAVTEIEYDFCSISDHSVNLSLGAEDQSGTDSTGLLTDPLAVTGTAITPAGSFSSGYLEFDPLTCTTATLNFDFALFGAGSATGYLGTASSGTNDAQLTYAAPSAGDVSIAWDFEYTPSWPETFGLQTIKLFVDGVLFKELGDFGQPGSHVGSDEFSFGRGCEITVKVVFNPNVSGNLAILDGHLTGAIDIEFYEASE